jgi:hypothetical protein
VSEARSASLLPSCRSRLLADETRYYDSSAVIVVTLRLRLQQTICWLLRRRLPLHTLPLQPSVHSASVDEHSSNVFHTQATGTAAEQPEKRYPEVLATLRTVFDLADSVCDGCQIWGLKAAFSTAAKGIKALQVRHFALTIISSRSYPTDGV